MPRGSKGQARLNSLSFSPLPIGADPQHRGLLLRIRQFAQRHAWMLAAASHSCTLWLAVPIYLLWRQQRSFANGGVYLFLVSFELMYAVLAGISA